MRKLRLGAIGGGPDAFIGAVHRTAAVMDGSMELVCGAFSSSPERSQQMGNKLSLQPERIYGSYTEMIEKEKALPGNIRMDAVSIVTPNHLHFKPAKMALEAGFHVVLDKPMTFDLTEAKSLKKAVEKSGLYFCLTHTYTGYPMIKEARQQVKSGKLGTVRKIFVTYPQGWLSTPLEQTENKQASWRTDPSKSGKAGCMGDIGTHAFNLAEYISGQQVSKLCADINILVPGRQLDDDGAVLLRFEGGASGVLVASQVLAGEENDLTIKVYGDKGGLEWKHSDPNTLLMKYPDRPAEIWRAGTGYLSAVAKHNTRTPAGHPEGFLEAFANHYRNFGLCVQAKIDGVKPKEEWLDFPGVDEGIRGMAFIDHVIASGQTENKWTDFTI